MHTAAHQGHPSGPDTNMTSVVECDKPLLYIRLWKLLVGPRIKYKTGARATLSMCFRGTVFGVTLSSAHELVTPGRIEGPCGMPGIEYGWALDQVNALPSVLSLCPHHWVFELLSICFKVGVLSHQFQWHHCSL